jgi:hypothetical protein
MGREISLTLHSGVPKASPGICCYTFSEILIVVDIHDRIDELLGVHGNYRALGRWIKVDHAYLKRLRDGTKVNPSIDVCRKLGLKKKVIIEYTDLSDV